MGTAVSQSAAMAVASPSFVVALANDFATIPKLGASLSCFGAMSFSWRMSHLPGLRRERKRVCDRNHNLVELEKAIAPTRPLVRFRMRARRGALLQKRTVPPGRVHRLCLFRVYLTARAFCSENVGAI